MENGASENAFDRGDGNRVTAAVEELFSPESNWYFEGAGRAEIYQQLLHWARFGGGCSVVVGPEGVGKTFLCRKVSDALTAEIPVVQVSGSVLLSGMEIFPVIAETLGAQGVLANEVGTGEALASIRASLQSEASQGCLLVIDDADDIDDSAWSVLLELSKDSLNQLAPLKILAVGSVHLLTRLDQLSPIDLPIADVQMSELEIEGQREYVQEILGSVAGDHLDIDLAASEIKLLAGGSFGELQDAIRQRIQQSFAAQAEPKFEEVFTEAALDYESETIQADDVQAFNHGLVDSEVKETSPFRIVILSLLLTGGLVTWLYWPSGDQGALRESVPIEIPDEARQISVPSVEQKVAVLPETSEVRIDTPSSEQVDLSSRFEQALSVHEVEEDKVAVDKSFTQLTADSPEPVEDLVDVASGQSDAPAELLENSVTLPNSMSDDERFIESMKSESFLVQVLGVSKLESARGYVKSLSSSDDWLIYRSIRSGKPWFSVVYKESFKTSELARVFIGRLPQSQKKAGAWPINVAAIKQKMRDFHE